MNKKWEKIIGGSIGALLIPSLVFGATLFMDAGTDSTQDLGFYLTGGTVNGTITSASDQAHTGSRSLKSNVTIANGEANVTTPTTPATASDAGGVISAYVYFSSAAPSTNTVFIRLEHTTSGSIICVGITTTGKLIIQGNGTIQKTGSTVLSANTWYRVTLGYKITTSSNWSAQVYLNGVAEVSTSNTDGTLGLTGSTDYILGIGTESSFADFGGSSVLTVWFDDVYINNNTTKTDPGDIRVTAKRPFANGTTNGFTTQVGSGGSGYGTGHAPQVNERPLSTTNGWSMIGAGSAVTEEYNIEGKTVGDITIQPYDTIVDYTGWFSAKSLVGETAQIIVNGVSTAQAITSTNTLYTKVAGSTVYPTGTGADIGITTDTSLTTVTLNEAGVLVAFTPGVAPNLSTFQVNSQINTESQINIQ